jgi:peroxisomal 3,2-trans-enoyl-CoA isomerase
MAVTLITGDGDYFSAGADVTTARPSASQGDGLTSFAAHLQRFAATNVNLTQAAAVHSKILVAGLNGPAIGFAAALLGHADFIFARPEAWLLCPFTASAFFSIRCSRR